MNALRKEALHWYKTLLRTRNHVFAGDCRALEAARQKIREEFLKCKDMTDAKAIKERLFLAEQVDIELRSSVVQAVRVEENVYHANFTPDTAKIVNVPFDPNAKLPPPRSKKCGDGAK
ncbi:complex III assembly factor LYRM7 [Uranotaenia lowii]|uniref:complex III assembly factor LYRM7 n=1 Tax=Uranotaenia lowii TaxID=190385 RepID=UPI0024789AAA|nr:complex III assembly factor LYRM7 [Uranotaenia lowii]